MAAPTMIIGIAKAGSAYVLFTSDEREHVAVDEAGLGTLIASLLVDPSIGHAEQMPATAAKIRTAAVKIAGRMLPGYEELSEPVVDGLTAFGRFLHKKINAPRPPKPPRPRQPAPRAVRRKAETAPG